MHRWPGASAAGVFVIVGALVAGDDVRRDAGGGGQASAEATDVDALRAAVEAAPQDLDARRRLALALYRAGRLSEAVGLFEQLAQIDPGERSLLDLALAYGSAGRFKDAEAVFRRLLALSPEHPVALVNVGTAESQRGNTQRAIELYRRAMQAKPDDLQARSYLADALRQSGRPDEAYVIYTSILDLKPASRKDVTLYHDAAYQVATIDIGRGEYDRAERLLGQLLEAAPDHVSAHYAYGQLLLETGREEQARAEFDKHLQILGARQVDSQMAMGQ